MCYNASVCASHPHTDFTNRVPGPAMETTTKMDLNVLNPEQREAVLTTEGPLLVLAGAGSGKTRVLTHRIAYLIGEKGVLPRQILALTFTNKAAGEMRERVEALVGGVSSEMWVMTFHSCCARILRMEIEHLGYERSFTIYDDADQQTLLRRIIRELNLNDKIYTPRMLSSKISDAKNHSLQPEQFLRESYAQQPVIDVFHRYQTALRQNNALDFDDLLLKVLELFERFPDVRETYQQRFRYILVDEYQDTNLAQYHLVRQLAAVHRNLCVVGDDDQSIYGWRGADIRNILEFEKDFPGAKVIRLEQNYRSTSRILEAANRVIANNGSRKPKTLWTDRKGGDPIALHEARDERDEAAFVCGSILQDLRQDGRRYSDYAILYRTHAQSRVLEMYLQSYSIPYRVYGGLSFFQRVEVKDILSYLRLLQNPNDDIAFTHAVSTPRRSIGSSTLAQLQAAANAQGLSLFAAAMAGEAALPPKLAQKFAPFCAMMQEVYGTIGVQPLAESMEQLLAAIDYDTYLREDRKGAYETRAEIVEELVNYARQFEEEFAQAGQGGQDVLQSFLEMVSLFSATDALDETTDRVSMMTLHSAKGLEFPVVFLTGMEDGLFPSSQSRYDPAKLEEERRLCYVGITRAKETLILTRAKQRMLYGKIEPAAPSMFLDELGDLLPDRDSADADAFGRESKFGRDGAFGHESTFGRESAFGRTAAGFQRGTPAPAGQAARPVPPAGGFGAQPVRTPKPVPTGAVLELEAGQRVLHKAFGPGTVCTVTGSGNHQIVEIAFDNGATKKFAAAYAPITAMED